MQELKDVLASEDNSREGSTAYATACRWATEATQSVNASGENFTKIGFGNEVTRMGQLGHCCKHAVLSSG
jgi:hypothetical protein